MEGLKTSPRWWVGLALSTRRCLQTSTRAVLSGQQPLGGGLQEPSATKINSVRFILFTDAGGKPIPDSVGAVRRGHRAPFGRSAGVFGRRRRISGFRPSRMSACYEAGPLRDVRDAQLLADKPCPKSPERDARRAAAIRAELTLMFGHPSAVPTAKSASAFGAGTGPPLKTAAIAWNCLALRAGQTPSAAL